MVTRAVWWSAILALATAAVSQSARADNLFWTGAHGAQYDDWLNWSFFEGLNPPPAGTFPGPGNFAVFEQGAGVSFSDFAAGAQVPSVDALQIFNGGVSFALGPVSYTDLLAHTYSTSQLYVVAPFEDGNFLSNYNLPNANGSLLVSGGTMVVNGQTVVGAGDSRNTGTLTLVASELETNGDFTIAQVGHGYFNVGMASLVTSKGGNVTIGNQVGSTAAATVSGGSAWMLGSSSPLTVGSQGAGSLLVEGGSLVAGDTLNIGTTGQASATVTVDGSGSQLSFTHLNIGAGSGSLTVQNGASAVSGTSDGSVQTSIGVLEGGAGAATVTGAGSSWTTNDLAVGGGNTGHGSLTISSGGSVASRNAWIGGGQGSVQLAGSGSTWTVAGSLFVSQFGNSIANLNVGAGSSTNVGGVVQINQGGSVQVTGTLSAASLNVAGGSFLQTGSVSLSDDTTHVGTLTISNGGSYSGSPVLGVATPGNSDAAGYAYVEGGGSNWTIPGPYLLGAGAGPVTANVNTGGTVDSGDVGIGTNSAGQLQIDGSGSSWSSTGTITVGSAAKGRINLSNGGSISASAIIVGAQGGISATDSTLTANSLNICGMLTLSNATLNVNHFNLNGGTITALTPLTGDISGYGVLVGAVSSASLTPTGNLTLTGNKNDLGSQSAVLLSKGAAHIDGVLTSEGGTLTSDSGIAIDANGALSGVVTVHGDVTNDGLLDVGGDSVGLDAIYGNLTLDPTGVIRIKVGGTDPSDYDQIMVKDGNVTLGGTLDLMFVNGFLPKQGDQFNIFVDDFSGTFSNVEVSGLGNWNYAVAGGPTGVTLNSLSDALAVPEPGTLLLLTMALPLVPFAFTGLCAKRRGKRFRR